MDDAGIERGGASDACDRVTSARVVVVTQRKDDLVAEIYPRDVGRKKVWCAITDVDYDCT
jgi:hypothetical protein